KRSFTAPEAGGMGVTWDLLIRRGLIIDGSGRPGVVGDVAVAGGRIAALGAPVPGDAKKIIDADGLAVTPGFIAIKTHSDFVLPINPKAESKVRQGVTTEIVGHCGFLVAPVLPGKGTAFGRLSERRRAVATVPRNDLSGIPRQVSRSRGQRRDAGGTQHAQA